MMNKIVLGIAGAKQAGKDTAADAIRSFFTRQDSLTFDGIIVVEKFSMAYPIKFFGLSLGLSRESLVDPAHKEDEIFLKWGEINQSIRKDKDPSCRMTARQFMQYFGSQCVRYGFCEDLWPLSLIHRINSHYQVLVEATQKELREEETYRAPLAVVYLVPDIRFQNEMKYIRNIGGYIWKIERDSTNEDCHVSQQLAKRNDCFDVIIQNDVSLNEYRKCVIEKFLRVFGSKFNIDDDDTIRDIIMDYQHVS